MRLTRKIMSWVFAMTSVLVALGGSMFFAQTLQVQRQYAFSRPWMLLIDAVFPSMLIVFGVAWWTTWKALPSAKVWGMAAGLTYVLVSLWQITHGSQSDWGVPGVEFILGVVGLIAFSPRPRKRYAMDEARPEDEPR